MHASPQAGGDTDVPHLLRSPERGAPDLLHGGGAPPPDLKFTPYQHVGRPVPSFAGKPPNFMPRPPLLSPFNLTGTPQPFIAAQHSTGPPCISVGSSSPPRPTPFGELPPRASAHAHRDWRPRSRHRKRPHPSTGELTRTHVPPPHRNLLPPKLFHHFVRQFRSARNPSPADSNPSIFQPESSLSDSGSRSTFPLHSDALSVVEPLSYHHVGQGIPVLHHATASPDVIQSGAATSPRSSTRSKLAPPSFLPRAQKHFPQFARHGQMAAAAMTKLPFRPLHRRFTRIDVLYRPVTPSSLPPCRCPESPNKSAPIPEATTIVRVHRPASDITPHAVIATLPQAPSCLHPAGTRVSPLRPSQISTTPPPSIPLPRHCPVDCHTGGQPILHPLSLIVGICWEC